MKGVTVKKFIFPLLILTGSNLCARKFSAEIYIKSQTYWFVDEKFSVGEGGKIRAYAYITDYSESPYLFDNKGVAKAYRIYIKVNYKILCQDRIFSDQIYFDEIFTASDPASYRSGLSRARGSLKHKLKNSIITLAKSNCG